MSGPDKDLKQLAESLQSRVKVEAVVANVIDKFGGIPAFANHVYQLIDQTKSEAIKANLTINLMRLMLAVGKNQAAPEDDDTEDLEAELRNLDAGPDGTTSERG